MAEQVPGRIVLRGRSKAYRPLPPERRHAILADGVAAYERGDFFLAHELLEPAWMGASDPAERDLYQGLIKLAAAFVHAVRGNPLGVRKNLLGSRALLAEATDAGAMAGIDVPMLVVAIDARLKAGDADDRSWAEPAIAIARLGEEPPD